MAVAAYLPTAKDKARIAKVVRRTELNSPAQTNNSGAMYQIPNLPPPFGEKYSFGVTFPSSIYNGTNMSTVLACAAGPVTLPSIGLSTFPATSCVLRHASAFNHAYIYYDSPAAWGLSTVLTNTEGVNPSTFPSNMLNWLYTVRMKDKWVDSVVPRPLGGSGGGSGGGITDWRVNKITHHFEVKRAGGDWEEVTDDATSGGTLDEDVPTAGADGADGNTILNGSGAPPSDTGANGDFYLDTAATTLYGPKTAGAWGSGVILIGAGAEFPDGAANGDVPVWVDGAWATPSAGTPADKDMLRWDNTNKKYVKVTPDHSLEINGSAILHLKGDSASPGNNYVYGTDGSGNRAWIATVEVST